jgi:sugar/nucleoside kinase (ribokinase family)
LRKSRRGLSRPVAENHKPDYIAGGSGQNTARVAQWLLQTPHAATYLGAVGKDSNAKRLADAVHKDGVNAAVSVASPRSCFIADCLPSVSH